MSKMHWIGLCALTLALAGCGDQPGGKEAAPVAAKVNGEAVTVPRLNHELAKLGTLDADQTAAATSQILRSMVDQRILVQQAQGAKLDEDPEVRQELEAARDQILSQAYVRKLTAGLPAPSAAEIADYYAKHPALFAERRVYRLQEITVQAGPRLAEVKAQLGKSGNLDQFIEWLKAEKIPARVGQTVKAAEQLPIELLPRLAELKPGQAMTMVAGGVLNVLVMAGAQRQPMAEVQARPVIERFLANARKRDAAAAELDKLRAKAKIEYLPPFAAAGKAPPAPPAVTETAVPPAPQAR